MLKKLAPPAITKLEGQIDTVGLVVWRHGMSIGEVKAKIIRRLWMHWPG